jgi:hypothetical protein
MKARFTVDGTAADGQTWFAEGSVTGEIPEIFTAAMRDAFGQLTQGRAKFGQPGVGCRGPYKLRKFELLVIEEVAHHGV